MQQQAGGMAIGAVGSGDGAPNFLDFGLTDDCLWWNATESHQDLALWAPTTTSAFWWPYFTTTIKWRGARRFSGTTDWYFVSDSSNISDNATHADGFFRLGFWDGTT